MATQSHTYELDKKFTDFLLPYAYPNISNEFTNFISNTMVPDGTLAVETLLELGIANEGNLIRNSVHGQDFSDGSDAKRTTVRTSSYGRKYSANVGGVHTKVGKLRVMCYERKLDKFYYFQIPNTAFSHISSSSNIEIPFLIDGTPSRIRTRSVISNWWNYEVPDFHTMCL